MAVCSCFETREENMNKIVSKGIKIDLHIHSEYSKNKDGQKVAENTLNNLDVLIHLIMNCILN